MRVALIVGGLVDLSGGLPLVFFPEATARWIGTPVDASQHFWPEYSSVFLFVLPVFYFIGATNPVRHFGIVIGAIAGRTLGGLFYGGWFLWHWRDRHWPLLVLASMNVLFAWYYAGLLGPQGRTLIREALRTD